MGNKLGLTTTFLSGEKWWDRGAGYGETFPYLFL